MAYRRSRGRSRKRSYGKRGSRRSRSKVKRTILLPRGGYRV